MSTALIAENANYPVPPVFEIKTITCEVKRLREE
jgi:hypothetical protein